MLLAAVVGATVHHLLVHAARQRPLAPHQVGVRIHASRPYAPLTSSTLSYSDVAAPAPTRGSIARNALLGTATFEMPLLVRQATHPRL